MSVPGCGTALAGMAKKKRIAQQSGERIVELITKNITPRQIINMRSLQNAIMVDMALGGSSNTILHLLAIANECDIKIPLKKFDEISKQTPHITNLRPGGEYFMEDLEFAGGIPAVLKRLKNKLHDNITVSGMRIKQIAAAAQIFDEDVKTDKGILLVSRGQEVSSVMIERLKNYSQTTGIREPILVILPKIKI